MFEIKIYTDGACSGNPGPGGWGALIVVKKNNKILKKKEMSGGCAETTNNRMEITAAIQALKILNRKSRVVVVTDSKYLMDGVTKWVHKWRANSWQNTKKQEIKNVDLWKELFDLTQKHHIDWRWVKGHNSHEENERADYLVRQGISQLDLDSKN